MKTLSVSQVKKIKELLSTVIPDNVFGIFFREYIFCESAPDWDAVLKLMLKHFPELTSEINNIVKHEVYAGKSNLPVGTKVQLQDVQDIEDLNGLTGLITHPFSYGNTSDEFVGFISDEFCAYLPHGGKFNVRITEFKIN